MEIKILHRWSLEVLFSHDAENNTMALTVKAAIAASANLRSANLSSANLRSANLSSADLSGANLSSANLSGANLSGANLRSANLSSADLSGANLSSADLRSANLSSANLRSANLSSANLRSANLSSADLSGANLSSADLSGADLRSADLRSADLRSANLMPIKADFIEVISQAPREVPSLIAALKGGRVDGSTYTGECACLVGTIANAQNLSVESSDFKLTRDSSRPVERFFMGISKGDTPETNQVSALALDWAEVWYATQLAAFAPQ
jgi:uncharacterized protein YjbI with pentapeptide repeats